MVTNGKLTSGNRSVPRRRTPTMPSTTRNTDSMVVNTGRRMLTSLSVMSGSLGGRLRLVLCRRRVVDDLFDGLGGHDHDLFAVALEHGDGDALEGAAGLLGEHVLSAGGAERGGGNRERLLRFAERQRRLGQR